MAKPINPLFLFDECDRLMNDPNFKGDLILECARYATGDKELLLDAAGRNAIKTLLWPKLYGSGPMKINLQSIPKSQLSDKLFKLSTFKKELK